MDEVAEPKSRVAAFLDRFATERNLSLPPLSPDGVGAIQRGSAVVTIHVLAEQGLLMLLAKVADAPAIDEPLARKLLSASFAETGAAAFALHPESGDLYLRTLRGLAGLEYDEFEDLVHAIAGTADYWDDQLA